MDIQWPLTLFTGLTATDTVSSIDGLSKEPIELKSFRNVREDQLLRVAKTHDALEKFHMNTAITYSKKINLAIELDKKRTGLLAANLDVGYYILRRNLRKYYRAELSLR